MLRYSSIIPKGRTQAAASRLLRLFSAQSRPFVHDDRWPGWEVVVGIEVHAQIKSRHKLFSDSQTTALHCEPNSSVSLFDAAFPGTLPTLNRTCVDLAIRAALALGCDIQPRSSFDRKHYFYSDLPAGYQITQRYAPFALGGHLQLPKPHHTRVQIQQIQLEQDTGKSTFEPRTRKSYIDLNRAGTGLMEIVSHPDMRSPEEAAAYVRSLQSILRAVGASDGNMEQGSLRCDVNVSVNRPGEPHGVRCEIKNLNSVKFMTIAIMSEIRRQIDHLDKLGIPVVQETRGFSEQRCETYPLRSKEDAPDYRYMPDPNIPPLLLTSSHIENVRSTLPALPETTRRRLQADYGLSDRDVNVLMTLDSGKEVMFDGEDSQLTGAIGYFERLCDPERKRDTKIAFNWMTHELLGQLSARGTSFSDNTIQAAQLGELIDLVTSGAITRMSGKALLRYLLSNAPSDKPMAKIASELQLLAMPSSTGGDADLVSLCRTTLDELPDEVAAIRQGNRNVLNKIVGAVMRKSGGRIDARKARECLENILGNGGDPKH